MACLDENQVLALVHARLTGDELHAAQQHLDSCMDCLDLVGFYQQSTQDTEEQETQDQSFVPLSESEEIDLVAPKGSTIGRYEVIRSLGRGGMGVVYLARDPKLDRRVALKLVKPSLQSDERAGHFEKRLMREARAMAKLAHPNVLTIYDVGIEEGQVFLASEWVDGCTLDVWMSEGPHRWPPVAVRFREAARGLVAAHAAGLVHRDFKPSNVMVGKDERVRVFDFGLVKATTANIGDITTQLSGNFVVGTPAYMSPEQMVGKTADERSDQFSFCASLYEALAGVRPFSGRNLTELLTNIAAGKFEEPKKIPKWLWDMIKRGLKKNPEDRHASMAEVLQILERGLDHRRRRSMMVAMAVLALVGATGGATGLWRGHSDDDALCGDMGSALGEAWSQTRRNAAETAILSSQAPYAQDAWRSAARLFDDYAEDWQHQLRSSCIDTRVKKQQSEAVLERRGQCFSRLRSELDSVSAVLVSGEAGAVRELVTLAQGLSPIASCSASRAQEEFNPLAAADEREGLEELWLKVKEVDTLVRTGKYAEALATSKQLLSQNHGNRQAEARLWASEGMARRSLGEYKVAVLALEKSFYAAVAGKHDDIAAHATTDIFSIVAVHLQDEERADRWRQLAESAVERVDSPLVLGKWRRALGRAAVANRDLTGAEQHFRASLLILEAELGQNHGEVASSAAALGRCLLRRHEPQKAEPLLQRAVKIWSSLVGATHPETAGAQIDMATALVDLGRAAEAEQVTERAVDALIAAFGEEHTQVAAALNSLAEYRVAAGDFEAANQTLLRSLRIKRAVHGNSHARLASTLTNLMDVDRMRYRPSDAVIHGSEALQILLAQPTGASNAQIRRVQLGVAEARLAGGDAHGARAICLELHQEAETAGSLSTTHRGRVLTCLGRASLAQGKKRAGRELLEQAMVVFGSEGARVRLAVALFELGKANATTKRGTHSAGIEEVQQALTYFTEAGPSWGRERQQVEAWLQQVGATTPSP